MNNNDTFMDAAKPDLAQVQHLIEAAQLRIASSRLRVTEQREAGKLKSTTA